MATEGAATLAAVDAYRLSRLRPVLAGIVRLFVIAMVTYVGSAAVLGAVAALFFRPSAGLAVLATACVGAPWLIHVLEVVKIAVAGIPRSVQVLPSGLRVQWGDRTEEWPWETVEWRRVPSPSAWLAPSDGSGGIHTWWVPDKQRDQFIAAASEALAAARGEREAERLIGGGTVAFPAAVRNVGIGLVLADPVYLALVVAGWIRAQGVPLSQVDDPLFRPALDAVAVLVVMLIVLVGRRQIRSIWGVTRFLPNGIEHSWPGGSRFIDYSAVTRLEEKRSRDGLSWLTVRAGRERLLFTTLSPLYFGVRTLLAGRTQAAIVKR